MRNKYYNDAIIGSENMVVSFSKKGELLRLFRPNPDYKQYVDSMFAGVKVNDSALVSLHDDVNNEYEQYYTEDTNILNTKIRNTYFNLTINQTDFVSISNDVLIKKYVFTNENVIDLDIDFLVYSKLYSNFNNMVGTKIENDVCMQYAHDFCYCIFSKSPILKHRLHNGFEDMKTGTLEDKDYIGIGDDSAVSYDIGLIKPGESKEFYLFIYINNNDKKDGVNEVLKEVERIKKLNINKELQETKKYWEKYVKEHDGLKILSKKEEWEKKVLDYKKVKKIYTRSILLFPLLTNSTTGGISAAVEVDEGQTKCGRYSYCWPRDAVFITKAMDLINMKNETEKFYTVFSKKTQSKNGMWEQRFYTDGRLAPCWGYQIDETASIVYGIYEHYKITKDKEFLNKTYDMCKKATGALEAFLSSISDEFTSKKEIELFKTYENYDLWEMNEGISLYSISAIYAAFDAMIHIEKLIKDNNTINIKRLEKILDKIKKYAKENFINEDNTLKRSNKDNKCDISLLGSIVPFNVFKEDEKQVENTIERIDLSLRTYTGGYLRFEDDNYLDGNYPWPIATLWMALYNFKLKDNKKALSQINFVTNSATKHGFLAEQVDNASMKAKWVIGLRMVTCDVYNCIIRAIIKYNYKY